MNSPAAANLCLSPAHKRKPSPTSCLGASKSKKLDLDDDEMLVNSLASIEVKKENIDPDEQEALENIELLSLLDRSLKQESTVPITSVVTPTSVVAHVDSDFQSQLKVEAADTDGTAAALENKMLDADLQRQLADQASSNKFLFYWFDLFEDQFNSNGTVYLFGKMPVKVEKQKKKEPTENVIS